ncbi:hypothetical protein BV20DRAFT_60939 [Pilatotrama ljubarskyi]|nr:hypothetical protein BV20DRAFT_60939 [Pilatotrama ljubarskyi]
MVGDGSAWGCGVAREPSLLEGDIDLKLLGAAVYYVLVLVGIRGLLLSESVVCALGLLVVGRASGVSSVRVSTAEDSRSKRISCIYAYYSTLRTCTGRRHGRVRMAAAAYAVAADIMDSDLRSWEGARGSSRERAALSRPS